jgi:hypothetical protein
VVYIDGVEKGRNKSVEKLSVGNSQDEINIINTFKELYKNTSPKLNAELLISTRSAPDLQPGNVYYKTVTGKRKRNLLNTYFTGFDKKNNEGYINKISEIFFIELECTPVCDYSQKKWLRSRILPGVMYPASFFNSVNQNSDSLYKEIPPFKYKNSIFRLIFDYRLFRSINLEDDNNLPSQFLFRLKSGVLVDIQARISSHVSRPGIITIS